MSFSRYFVGRTATGSGRCTCRAKFRQTISNSSLATSRQTTDAYAIAKSDTPCADAAPSSGAGGVCNFGKNAERGAKEIDGFQVWQLFAPQVVEKIIAAGAGSKSPDSRPYFPDSTGACKGRFV